MKALVADHSATTRRVVIRALRVLGIQDVLEIAHVREAEALPADADLVVLEWAAGDDAPIDFIQQIRARENGAQVKVIVLSERDRRPDIERILALDVQGYVLKPFETLVLIEQLATAILPVGTNARAA